MCLIIAHLWISSLKVKSEIRDSVRRFFGAEVYLFGSRTDDARRGGDIDLYIEAPMSATEAVRSRIAVLGHLYDRIGERKIDLLPPHRVVPAGFVTYSHLLFDA